MQSSAITCSVLCIHYISFNLYNHLDIYFMMLNPTKTLALLAYSRKKTNRGAEDILFWKLPWKFYICDNTLRTSRGNKLAPLEILHKVVWHLLETEFQGQKPRPMEILHQLKLIPGTSTCSFFNNCGNSMFSPHCLVLSWNSPLEFDKKLARLGIL